MNGRILRSWVGTVFTFFQEITLIFYIIFRLLATNFTDNWQVFRLFTQIRCDIINHDGENEDTAETKIRLSGKGFKTNAPE